MKSQDLSALSIELGDVVATTTLGAAIGAVLQGSDVVLLSGELGAGKTTLVKGLVDAFAPGISATSPTFALCHLYETSPVVAHVDCWRLAEESELDELALDELLEEGAVALIEWGALAGPRFGKDALEVVLEVTGAGRRARCSWQGAGSARLSDLQASCHRLGLRALTSPASLATS